MKDFLKQEWKFVLIFILVLGALGIGYYEYKQHQALPIQTIKQVTPDEVAQALIKMGVFKTQGDAAMVTERIIEREKSAPNITFTTKTQQEADKQANQIAKQDKADYVLKQPETAKDGTITNKYFGVHTERNNQIQAGVTVTDQVYFSLGYQHNNLDVIVHSKNFKGIDGASVMYTIKKW